MADCTAPGCEHGWHYVALPYAEHLAGDNDGTPAWRARVAALLNSVYPCRVCKPAAFFRWAGGHFAADHDAGSCPDCATPGQTRRRAPARTAASHEPPPVGEPPPDYDDGRFPE